MHMEGETDWWEKFTERLTDDPHGNIWTDGNEILVKTESAADTVADMILSLYASQGESITLTTGYYEPKEDQRNGEEDRYTGWWYVSAG